MLTSRVLVEAPELRVSEVRCPGHGVRWSPAEPVERAGFVLVRRGVYRRSADGDETVADAGSVYAQRPGTEQRIAHPAGGDLCTAIRLRGAGDAALPGADRPLPLGLAAQVAHRLLLAAETPALAADRATELVGHLLTLRRPAEGSPRPDDIRLAGEAREIIAADPGRPLPAAARELGVSPYRLSRVFSRVHGVTLSRYRLRLRATAALERLLAGDRDLAGLAAETGFADQAHLTRTLRSETGLTPGRLRALLGQSG